MKSEKVTSQFSKQPKKRSKDRYSRSNFKDTKEDSIFDSVNLLDSNRNEESAQKLGNNRSPLHVKHLVEYSHEA